MTKFRRPVLRILSFIAFVWLSKMLTGLIEVDNCFDLGGAVDHKTGICIGSREGQWALASAARFHVWLILLGLPALFIYGINGFFSWALRRIDGRRNA